VLKCTAFMHQDRFPGTRHASDALNPQAAPLPAPASGGSGPVCSCLNAGGNRISNHRSRERRPASLWSRFPFRRRLHGGAIEQRRHGPVENLVVSAVPMVRIQLPPPVSPLRTRLSGPHLIGLSSASADDARSDGPSGRRHIPSSCLSPPSYLQ
jgi:hypothetical protein